MPGENGKMLVIRHPNAGFRRFNILTDGRGLSPADGFDFGRADVEVAGVNFLGHGLTDGRRRGAGAVDSAQRAFACANVDGAHGVGFV